jgi:Family of unknown function (DUF6516)
VRELVAHFADLIRILGDELGAHEIGHLLIRVRAYQFGRLSRFLRYGDGSRLRIFVWADCRNEPILWTRYSFQYLDRDNSELFRYDNAPHHPQLPHFPNHLHLPNDVIGVPQPRPRELRDRVTEYFHRAY